MNFEFMGEGTDQKETTAMLSEVIARKNEEAQEHHTGPTYKELYPEKIEKDWDHVYGSVKNLETRVFLQRVRECKRSIELLDRRKSYRMSAGLSTDDLDAERQVMEDKLSVVTVTTADEISKIGNVCQEMVLIMRYIDVKTWDEIAEAMDLRVRTVLKFHGYGLIHLRDVLLADGLIQEESDDHIL